MDGVIYPSGALMAEGCEVAERLTQPGTLRVRLTRDDVAALAYVAAVGLAYGAEPYYPDMWTFRGKRYPDGSQDITGQQLTAMRAYWRANLPVILANRVGADAE
ncbi:hypothetical protein GKC29_27635 [Micromonospora sp. WMMC415]|uniref:hypothetical protein n=1 Tax=Micromonospora sp. WMMC415 TaxID=2675222 RepID=UPI0012B4D08A|nr:hypothetical protein [Micromonospora sp. WMMC415]QGN50219.1 hypothetical protein GKC29_27635 [Micromonospora sp. WMMC415]